jgi:glycosyltransferase involved in cell wall biosynthesis
MRHLKIIRVIARLNVGGPARHGVILDEGLSARGHRTLLVHGVVDDHEQALETFAEGARLRRLKIPELGRRVSLLADASAFIRVVRTVFGERPDVVHTHTAKAGVLGRAAAVLYNATRRRSRRCIVVHTFHGHVFEGYFNPVVNRAIRATERLLARCSDCLITISETQKADVVDRFAIARAQKVAVIPLGLELDDLLSLSSTTPNRRSELGIPHHDVVLGFVGRMVPIKDLETLLYAFATAARQTAQLRLLLAGDGQARPDLERLAIELGVVDRVHFVGWAASLPPLYATIDVGVISSINEGTPVALIEAMAAGRPVVATRVGGVPDLVADEITGLLVPPRSPDALAAAFTRLAGSRSLRENLGAEARAQVAGRYTSKRLVNEVESLYRTLLAVKRRPVDGREPV